MATVRYCNIGHEEYDAYHRRIVEALAAAGCAIAKDTAAVNAPQVGIVAIINREESGTRLAMSIDLLPYNGSGQLPLFAANDPPTQLLRAKTAIYQAFDS